MFTLLSFSLPLLLAVALYGYALKMPYFLDDGPHFVILGQTDGLLHWGDFAPFPFYRPLTFSVWKVFAPFGYPPFALHALNVFTLGVVGVLVGQIARRLSPTRKALAALIAGCGFVLFPFSVQAVVMVAAYFHLMLALGVTLSVLFGLRYLHTRRKLALMLTWLGAFIAAFSHESGVIVAALLPLALMVNGRGWIPRRDFLRVILPVWMICAVYLLLWWQFAPNEEARTLSHDIPAASAALLQGVAYPFVALARPLIEGDAHPALILVMVALGVGGWLALIRWNARRAFWPVSYGAAWMVLAILPAVLVLPAGYVLGQLRLAMLASVGASLLWGIGLASLRGRLASVALVILSVLTVYVSVDFLAMRRVDFERLAAWNAEAVVIAESLTGSVSGGIVLVNAPQNITPLPQNRRFLLGSEGVLWTDSTLDYSQQFWMNGADAVRGVQAVSVPVLVSASGVQYTTHGETMSEDGLYEVLRGASAILVTHYAPDGTFYPVLVGGEWVDYHLLPDFGTATYPEIGAELMTMAAYLHADGDLEVLSNWNLAQPAPVKMFMQVFSCGGESTLLAQNDGYVWGNLYPFRAWHDERQTDRRAFRLPDQTDCVDLYVGLYDENTGMRQKAYHAGFRLRDDAVTRRVLARHE